MAEFFPYKIALDWLNMMDVDFGKVYNGQDGIKRDQLTVISKISNVIGTYTDPNDGKEKTLKDNAYTTIHRLEASKNADVIDFDANIKGVLAGTVSSALMTGLSEKMTEKEQQNTIIKWIPSSAETPDPFHALNYGKTMSLSTARKKGLGTRYNCQCGFDVINQKTSKDIDNFLNSTIT